MNKYSVLLVTFLSLVVIANCGVIDNVYGRVKNTTNAVKDDLKSWWSYGKGLVFGDDEENQNAKPLDETENSTETNKAEIEKERGIIAAMYHKSRNGVLAVRKRIHDVILGEENSETDKGFVRNMYHRVRARIYNVRIYILGDDETKPLNNAYQNFSEETKVIREGINKVLLRGRTNLNKMEHNMSKELNTTGNVIADFVNNNKIDVTDKSIMDKVNNDVQGKLNTGKDNVEKSFNNFKDTLNETSSMGKAAVENVNNKVNDGLNKGQDDVKTSMNKVKQSVGDAIGKENELLSVPFDKIDDGVSKFKDHLRNSAEDTNQL